MLESTAYLTPDGRVAILELRLDAPDPVECIACGQLTARRQGLPMREGEVVENDDRGEWAGFDCCRSCYEAHAAGGVAALDARLRALRERAGTGGTHAH